MSAIFGTIATEKVKQMSEFYTWTILLIKQLGEIDEEQLSVFLFANSGDPDEMAPYEPSHQDFNCLLK